jgi:tRNA pseudouridine13 synthase
VKVNFLSVPELEKIIGIETYVTTSSGLGGKIRQQIDDFVVEELLINGSLAQVIQRTGVWEPIGQGSYLICVLVKRRWDTFLAIKKVAEYLHISPKRIKFAGIKDTKALTGQHISLQNASPNLITEIAIKDILLYPKYFSKERMYSQLIQGNRFHISLREVNYPPSNIKERFENIREEISKSGGVPNFFGHQRFGTIRPNTHQIGKYLTLGEIEKATLIFLANPSDHEHPKAKEARQQLQDSMDFRLALDTFPRFLRYERSMLYHLTRYPRDFIGAFRKLPRKLRKLFVQGYQSYLFNRFLSKRIQIGIPLNEAQIGEFVLKLNECGLPSQEFYEVTESNLNDVQKAINEKRICIASPLIGPNQPSSKGSQGEIEQSIIESENLNPENFRLPFMPEATAEGKLRSILSPIKDLVLEEIIPSSKMKNNHVIRLGFTLNRGCYATVLLREFMKPQDLIDSGY